MLCMEVWVLLTRGLAINERMASWSPSPIDSQFLTSSVHDNKQTQTLRNYVEPAKWIK